MTRLGLLLALLFPILGCASESGSEGSESPFAGVTAVRQAELHLGFASAEVQIAEVSPRFFGDTTLAMWLGRPFVESDFSSSARASIILTRPLWERLGEDPGMIGSTLELDGSPRVVLGVLAESPAFEARADGAVPGAVEP